MMPAADVGVEFAQPKYTDDEVDVIEEAHHCASEVYVDVNSADDLYAENVFADCHKVCRRMIVNTLLSTLIFITVLLFQALCVWNSDRLYAVYTNEEPVMIRNLGEIVDFNMKGLYDNLQVLFGRWYGNDGFSIRYVDSFIAALLIIVIVKVVAFTPAIFTCQMFIRYMVLMSQLYLIRGVFILATVVPIQRCDVLDLKTGFFNQYLHILAGYLSIKRTCTDVIISGHAAGTTTLVQFFIGHNRRWNLNTIVIILSSVIYCMLIAARSHYSIDVMFGIFFSVHLYKNHIHIVERAGRLALAENPHEDPLTPITKVIAGFELVEERVHLFLRLQELRRIIDSKPKGRHNEILEYYNNIFGLDDTIDVKTVYTGFDVWTTATFRLIKRGLRSREERKRVEKTQLRTENNIANIVL